MCAELRELVFVALDGRNNVRHCAALRAQMGIKKRETRERSERVAIETAREI